MALHAFLDRSVLGSGPVRYEVWAPRDFTEPAAKLIDGWPGSWRDVDWREDARKLLRLYAAFRNLA